VTVARGTPRERPSLDRKTYSIKLPVVYRRCNALSIRSRDQRGTGLDDAAHVVRGRWRTFGFRVHGRVFEYRLPIRLSPRVTGLGG
jgi:hypothetical protein